MGNKFFDSLASTLGSGILVVAPVYLGVLLLLKAMQSLSALVRPVARLVPDWLPAAGLLSLLVVLAVCLLVGFLVRTPSGHTARERLEHAVFESSPVTRCSGVSRCGLPDKAKIRPGNRHSPRSRRL